MRKADNSFRADIRGYMGNSGTGKSSIVREALEKLKPPRLLVWDFKNEYGDRYTQTDSIADLVAMVTEAKRGRFAAAFVPAMRAKVRDKQFDLFCRLTLQAGRVCAVVEELQFVTKPYLAPDAWSMLTCTGRAAGLVIIGTAQRPAHMDKNFLGNCTEIATCRIGEVNDAKVVAAAMPGVEAADLLALPDFHYVHRDRVKAKNRTGITKKYT